MTLDILPLKTSSEVVLTNHHKALSHTPENDNFINTMNLSEYDRKKQKPNIPISQVTHIDSDTPDVNDHNNKTGTQS